MGWRNAHESCLPSFLGFRRHSTWCRSPWSARYTVRHADVIEKGVANARSALTGGDSAIVALLLSEPTEVVDQSLRDVIS